MFDSKSSSFLIGQEQQADVPETSTAVNLVLLLHQWDPLGHVFGVYYTIVFYACYMYFSKIMLWLISMQRFHTVVVLNLWGIMLRTCNYLECHCHCVVCHSFYMTRCISITDPVLEIRRFMDPLRWIFTLKIR